MRSASSLGARPLWSRHTTTVRLPQCTRLRRAPCSSRTCSGRVAIASVLLPPSWPESLPPHTYTSPLCVTAAPCSCPRLASTTRSCARSGTGVGRMCELDDPVPRRCERPVPHTYSRPSVVSAPEELHPQNTLATVTSAPKSTCTGESCLCGVPTTPRRPWSPQPNAYTCPFRVSASVCRSPHDTACTPARPITRVGSSLSNWSPMPSRPWWLQPHVYRCPLVVTAALCRRPHATATTLRRVGISVSSLRSSTSRSPSFPFF